MSCVIQIPQYVNRHRSFALWIGDNLETVTEYWRQLGGDAEAHAEEFVTFARIQFEREFLKLH